MALMDQQAELRVLLQTLDGKLEGRLRISVMLRMLDDLNLEGNRFVTLHPPIDCESGTLIGPGPVSVNKDTLLFAVQQEEHTRRKPRAIETGQYTRAGLRLQMGAFTVHGFIHVARGGNPMKRLNGDRHAFVALTSASILGPGVELATPFLAVNRRHIALAQEIEAAEPAMASASAEGRATE